MKIGVISDTHDNLASMKRALDLFCERNVELIVHCGDWSAPFALKFFSQNSGAIPVKGVVGNNIGDLRAMAVRNVKLDKPVELAEFQVLELELGGRHMAAYHGDDPKLLKALIASGSYDVVFTGHTHQPRSEVVNGVLVVNPGATCFAVAGAPASEASVAVYDTASNSAEFITYTALSLYSGA